MFSQSSIQSFVDLLVAFATDLLLPLMVFTFTVAVITRVIIYYTVRREATFAREFEKRSIRFLDEADPHDQVSFFAAVKKNLERTFYEMFIMSSIMKRRKPDFLMPTSDRFFLVRQGAAWLVKDVLQQIKHLKHDVPNPKLFEISKNVAQRNPAFNKVLGFLPTSHVNEILNILPGIFIIGGIFGTFLGIMKALPELGTMDLNDIEGAKTIMDQFLMKISFSMSTSLVGILLSVLMSFTNTLFSADRMFSQIIDRFENTLDLLWNRSNNNQILTGTTEFDENKDSLEALAEQALNEEIDKTALTGNKRHQRAG